MKVEMSMVGMVCIQVFTFSKLERALGRAHTFAYHMIGH